MDQPNVVPFQKPLPNIVTQEELEEVLRLDRRLKEKRRLIRSIFEAGGAVESGPRRIRIENHAWALNGILIIIE